MYILLLKFIRVCGISLCTGLIFGHILYSLAEYRHRPDWKHGTLFWSLIPTETCFWKIFFNTLLQNAKVDSFFSPLTFGCNRHIEFYSKGFVIIIERCHGQELSIVNNAVAVQMGGGHVDFSIFGGTVSRKYMSLVPPLYISQNKMEWNWQGQNKLIPKFLSF